MGDIDHTVEETPSPTGRPLGRMLAASWHSYPSIYNFGHKAVQDLFSVPVYVEEKVDGSQFSFGRFVDEGGNMELRIRSKGATIIPDAPPAMFRAAVETVQALQTELTPGWTYRGEVLAKPKHNTLHYERVPAGHIVLFDINDGHESYLSYAAKKHEATRLGLETVPLLYWGQVVTADQLRALLSTISVLGGQRVEGVVVKPIGYGLFGLDKKALMGKFVSEEFKEMHTKAWADSNPTKGDIVERIVEGLRQPARWNKAIIHLRERGLISDDAKDIGAILKEVAQDLDKEAQDEVKDALFKAFWRDIKRRSTTGLPEWYKQQLLTLQFEREAQTPATPWPGAVSGRANMQSLTLLDEVGPIPSKFDVDTDPGDEH